MGYTPVRAAHSARPLVALGLKSGKPLRQTYVIKEALGPRRRRSAATYDPVNGVKDQSGGWVDGRGPTIADGMVFQVSGFKGSSNTGGNPIAVLLAFSVDEK